MENANNDNGLTDPPQEPPIQPITRPRRGFLSGQETIATNGIYAHRYPRMDEGYYRRLASYLEYPAEAPMTKEELAWAGFLYTGQNDRVRCEFCNLELQDWQENDVAFGEHCRMRPECPFILPRTARPVDQNMRYLYDRRITFNSPTRPWPHTGDSAPLPSELADAGFYYTGQADRVKCFQCGLILHSWEPMGLPWHAHAKYSPVCAYLIVEKGIDWIRACTGIDPFRRMSEPNSVDMVTVTGNESPLQFEEDDDETDDGLLDISHQLGSLSIGVGLSGRPPEPLAEIEEISKENILQEFQQARSEQRCKVCLVNRATVVFLPCLHLSACPACTQQLQNCPICRQRAQEVLEIFIT